MTLASVDWGFIWDHLPELLRGLGGTLEASGIAIAGASAIGLVLAARRAYRVPVLSQVAAIYVEVIRNTPILVQIFFIFYGLPQFGIRLTPYTTAWLSVMIWGGAFNTENFRAGFGAVPARYREGAAALGFGSLATFFNIVLPIGGRIALPSSINTYISVLKNTSLMTAIGFPELTNVARSIAAVTFRDAEMLLMTAVIYLALRWTLSAGGRRLRGG